MDVHDAGSLRKGRQGYHVIALASLSTSAASASALDGAQLGGDGRRARRPPTPLSTRTASRWRLLARAAAPPAGASRTRPARRSIVHASTSALDSRRSPSSDEMRSICAAPAPFGERRERLVDRPRRELDGLAGRWRASPATPLGRQHERIRHDDDAAAERLRELPAADGLDGAVLDTRVAQRRVLQDRRDDLTRRRDRELHHDAAAEVRLLRQLLLVAVLHLVDVAPDDAADDLLVERSADVGDAREHVGRPRAPAAQPAGAAAVARAVAVSVRRRPFRSCRGCRGRWCLRRCRRRPRPCRPGPARRRRDAAPIWLPIRPPRTSAPSLPSALSPGRRSARRCGSPSASARRGCRRCAPAPRRDAALGVVRGRRSVRRASVLLPILPLAWAPAAAPCVHRRPARGPRGRSAGSPARSRAPAATSPASAPSRSPRRRRDRAIRGARDPTATPRSTASGEPASARRLAVRPCVSAPSVRPIQTAPPVIVRSRCHSPSPRASRAGWPGRGRSASTSCARESSNASTRARSPRRRCRAPPARARRGTSGRAGLDRRQPDVRVAASPRAARHGVAAETVLARPDEQHRGRAGLARARGGLVQRALEVQRARRRDGVELRERAAARRRVRPPRRSARRPSRRPAASASRRPVARRTARPARRAGAARSPIVIATDVSATSTKCGAPIGARLAHHHLLERVARRPPREHLARIGGADGDRARPRRPRPCARRR